MMNARKATATLYHSCLKNIPKSIAGTIIYEATENEYVMITKFLLYKDKSAFDITGLHYTRPSGWLKLSLRIP